MHAAARYAPSRSKSAGRYFACETPALRSFVIHRIRSRTAQLTAVVSRDEKALAVRAPRANADSSVRMRVHGSCSRRMRLVLWFLQIDRSSHWEGEMVNLIKIMVIFGVNCIFLWYQGIVVAICQREIYSMLLVRLIPISYLVSTRWCSPIVTWYQLTSNVMQHDSQDSINNKGY